MQNDFAAFILTHGRPENVKTYKSLIGAGYTGKIYIVIDNEDKTANKYKEIYKDKVIMFDKEAISKTFDEGDNFKDRRSIVYARNACFKIAKKLGVKYFIELDDDYTAFDYRIDENYQYKITKIKSIDKIFEILLDYYKSLNFASIAFSQGGDYIGGADNGFEQSLHRRRKCMNTFICSTDREFQFVGRINEDVNTYTNKAKIGLLFLTIPMVSITQMTTQSNKGGMTDIYLDNGTYIKSFYTVIYSPSCVKVQTINGSSGSRLHHKISWINTCPVIIREEYKK